MPKPGKSSNGASGLKTAAASGIFLADEPQLAAAVARVARRLPPLTGRSVRIGRMPGLRSRYGASHAGTFLRERKILFDCVQGEFARIFVHELFHFVWLRAGNPARASFGCVLAEEMLAGARGELGWSAELRKRALTAADWGGRTRRWREYSCESFCDTAAWIYSGVERHDEFTLSARCRKIRRSWFEAAYGAGEIPI